MMKARQRGPSSGSEGAHRQAPPAQLRVRILAPGIDGEELRRQSEARLIAGALWRRGEQVVRIRAVTAGAILFRELNHGRAQRRSLTRAAFLRSSRPA